ncbi:wlm-domain-containing protein [Stemphylium lycopersici]|nr:wlm-domain-containing protein [Stemphylium lycopersici]
MHHKISALPPIPGLDGHISTYYTLDHYPNAGYALHRLREVAYIIAPIVARHAWHIPILRELSPYSSCLGKNQLKRLRTTNRFGVTTTEVVPVHIELRLRDHRDPAAFIPMRSLLRTMLHELAHFEYGRHFPGFYRFNRVLLEELVRDVEKGELRGWVKRERVPVETAGLDEIMDTMIEDVKKCWLEVMGKGGKGGRSIVKIRGV